MLKELRKEQDMNSMKKVNEIRIGFIADNIKDSSKIDIFHDSTFALMLAAQDIKAQVLYAQSNCLKIINNKVFAKFDEVTLRSEIGNHIDIKSTKDYSLDSLDIIFARKDPPVDQSFLSYLLMLSLVPHIGDNSSSNSRTLIVNSPLGMLKANEKLYALNFPGLIPQTLVSSQVEEMKDFLSDNKEAVLKSLFFMGGREVFYLNKDSKDSSSIIESAIQKEGIVLIQKYLPEVKAGDKRIILLDGTPIGALTRIPKAGEFRANMNQGASIKSTTLSQRDLEICEVLKPYLQKDGLYFTGIDVIGDYLIEVNVTSPTCLQEIERFTGRQLAKEIVLWAIEKVGACYSKP